MSDNNIDSIDPALFYDSPELIVVTLFGNPVARSKETKRELKDWYYDVKFIFH